MLRAGQTPHGARSNREEAPEDRSAYRLGAPQPPGRSLEPRSNAWPRGMTVPSQDGQNSAYRSGCHKPLPIPLLPTALVTANRLKARDFHRARSARPHRNTAPRQCLQNQLGWEPAADPACHCGVWVSGAEARPAPTFRPSTASADGMRKSTPRSSLVFRVATRSRSAS